MTFPPAALIAAFAALVAGTVVGVEARRRAVFLVCKPAATLALLGVLGYPPEDTVQMLCAYGILVSVLGDVALLGESRAAFLAGMVCFATAHVLYAIAFHLVGRTGLAWLAEMIVFAMASAAVVQAIWRGVHRSLRAAVVGYAGVITVMVASAFGTLDGGAPGSVAVCALVGASLFYASDVLLAWRRFRGDFPHARTLALLLYWAGQLAIALALRSA